MKQARAKVDQNKSGSQSPRYEQYQKDPVGFGEQVLGESYTDDVKAVMESVRDFPVTVARSANAVGKSHGAARIAVWFYKAFPDAQIYTTAAPPESNLRRILWGEIFSVMAKHPQVFKGDRMQSLNIQARPQNFITGVAIPASGTSEQREAKFSGKHAPNLLFIVDEGDAVPPEVYRGIESCMSGGNARLLVMFNPRASSGPVYNMERTNAAHIVQLSAFNHPNVISGEDKIPGAVTLEKTLRRINEWSRPLMPGESVDRECFEVPDFLVGEIGTSTSGEKFPPLPAGWRKVTNSLLFYMVLGIYPPQAQNQLINRAWIDAAQSRWATYVARYGEMAVNQPIMSLDVAEFGRDFNVAIFRWGGFVARPVIWNGVDVDATALKSVELYEQYHATLCNVDATGVGAGVAPRMYRLNCNAAGIKVASSPTYKTEAGEFAQLRDQLWWSVREWLRTDTGAMLPPDEDLAQELTTPMYEIVNGKVKITEKKMLRELLGRSPDKADALCLSFAEGQVAEYGANPLEGYRG